MSNNKRLYIKNLLLDIQKTFILYKQDINNKFTNTSLIFNKKAKYSNYPLLLTSLIDNNNILKIMHYNVIFFTNPTK